MLASICLNLVMMGARGLWVTQIPMCTEAVTRTKMQIKKSRITKDEEEFMDESVGLTIAVQSQYEALQDHVQVDKYNNLDSLLCVWALSLGEAVHKNFEELRAHLADGQ